MGLQADKVSVAQKVLILEQQALINKLNRIIEEERIVGYTVKGQSLTKAEYNQRLATAEQQLKNGETISQEDLEKESENW